MVSSLKAAISIGALFALGMSMEPTAARAQGSPQTRQAQPREERMSYLDNGEIRLGVDLDLGGAITYLSKSKSDVNLINSFDRGRQIQMSHYAGPIPFAPHGKQPKPEWAGLGWNPIQVGDAFGNRARIIESRNDGKTLYVKCIPMQWPLDNEPGECAFECWIHLEGATAQVRSRMVNRRADKTQYEGRDQELPAIYTNGPWHRLMTYAGDRPFQGDALSAMPEKMPWSGWQATENWAALVNDEGTGLGIWQPGVYSFIGGFAGMPGEGGPKDLPTGYIAPTQVEILDHNIDYEYRYVLILGSLDEIRKYVYDHAAKNALPTYHFKSDRQRWHYVNAGDTGWPIRGELKVLMEKPDPQLIGPSGFWPAEQATKLHIRAAFHTSDSHAQAFWKRFDEPQFSVDKSLTFDVIPDGKYHDYVVDLAASREYRGAITGLRFDPEPNGKPGDYALIESISLEGSKARAKDSKETNKKR